MEYSNYRALNVLSVGPTNWYSSDIFTQEDLSVRRIPGIKAERAWRGNFKGVSLWLDGITLGRVDQASMNA